MRATGAAVVAVIPWVVASGCHARDRLPPAPIVEHPAALAGRVFAVVGIDAHRVAVAYAARKDAPISLAVWQDGAPVWALATSCDRVDLAPETASGWKPGMRFVAVTAADDVVTVTCPDPGDRVRRTTAFRTRDGSRAWVGEPRDETVRYELAAERAGGGVIAYDERAADVFDAATGATLARFDHVQNGRVRAWPSPPRVAVGTWDPKAFDRVTLLDAGTGVVLDSGPGILHCALPDAIVVIRRDDDVRVGLDGKETPLPARAFVPGDAPCSTRGDRTIVLTDVDAGVNVTEISAAGVRGRSLLIEHAGAFEGEPGWDRPLPRFVAVATHRNSLAIVDVDDMRLVRTVVPAIDAPERSAFVGLAGGRTGDTWVGLSAFGLWGVDGTTGQLVALRDEAIADPYWLDLAAEIASPPWWIARDRGSALAFEPAALVADSDIARALETAAAGE